MIQAFYSRAGLQDDARWQSTPPSNYYYYYYYYYYHYYHYYDYYYYYYYYYFSLEKGAVLTNLQAASHLLRQPAVRIPFDE